MNLRRFCLRAICQRAIWTSVILPAAFAQTYTTLEIGAFSTTPTSINSSGDVTGYYLDSNQGPQHGFLRTAGGTVTTFDPPGSVQTSPCGINSSGEIVGFYGTNSPVTGQMQYGFLRASDGTITTITIPGFTLTGLSGINSAGDIAGGVSLVNPATHEGVELSFVLTSGGTLTTYCNGIPVTGTAAYDCRSDGGFVFINDTDAIAGSTGSGAVSFSYVRPWGGTTTIFKVPSKLNTGVSGINDSGTVIGYAENDKCTREGVFIVCDPSEFTEGFVRTSDGTLTTFQGAEINAFQTLPAGINASGEITGSYLSIDFSASRLVRHGFARNASGVIASFDPPGSIQTTPTSINDSGAITGSFYTGTGAAVGFIRTP